MPCLDSNGAIRHYSVNAMEAGVVKRTINVSSDVREAIVSEMSPSTWYTVRVAAVNGAGIGPYSNGISVRTSGKQLHYFNFVHTLQTWNLCAVS